MWLYWLRKYFFIWDNEVKMVCWDGFLMIFMFFIIEKVKLEI